MTGLRVGSVCSGYGGLDMAVTEVFGGEMVWVADPDPGAAAILAHHWPEVPNLGDITSVDWTEVPPVDVAVGGYPCQPFSDAGLRKGTADDRHIWPHIATALGVLRPKLAVFENVSGHLRRGFDAVLSDLARLGFDAEWRTLRASDVGAPHRRERLWILAWPADTAGPGLEARREGRFGGSPAADAPGDGRQQGRPQPARLLGGLDAALRGSAVAAHTDGGGLPGYPEPNSEPAGPEADHERGREHAAGRVLDWGRYAAAVHRWEAVLGRPAPAATEPGRGGRPRLSPRFVEWLMGLDEGHVTDVPGLSRNQQLKALGNGVVPQQGATAITHLLDRATPRETSREAA
ncbi:DNA cytosine methyltransferase [Streptomyces mayteni]